jgi:triosephosphate isomerase
VGERLEERDAGQTDATVERQVAAAFEPVEAGQVAECVIAYEPVWAIGTGRAADGAEANRVCGVIRQALAGRYGPEAAAQVRIQYGGSVTGANIAEFIGQPEIDGALVGGASLKAAELIRICEAAAEQARED